MQIHGQAVDKRTAGGFMDIVMHKTYADRWIHGKVEDKLGRTGDSWTNGGQGLGRPANHGKDVDKALVDGRIHVQVVDKA